MRSVSPFLNKFLDCKTRKRFFALSLALFLLTISSASAADDSENTFSPLQSLSTAMASFLIDGSKTSLLIYRKDPVIAILLSEELQSELRTYGTIDIPWIHSSDHGWKLVFNQNKLQLLDSENQILLESRISSGEADSPTSSNIVCVTFESEDTCREVTRSLYESTWTAWGEYLYQFRNVDSVLNGLNFNNPKSTVFQSMIADHYLSISVVMGYQDNKKEDGPTWTIDKIVSRFSAATLAYFLGLTIQDSNGNYFSSTKTYNGQPTSVVLHYQDSGVVDSKSRQNVQGFVAKQTLLTALKSDDIVIYDGHSRYGRKLDFGPLWDSKSNNSISAGSILLNFPISFYKGLRSLRYRKETPQALFHLGCNSERLYESRLTKSLRMKGKESHPQTRWYSVDGDIDSDTGPITHVAAIASVLSGLQYEETRKLLETAGNRQDPNRLYDFFYQFKK